MVLDNCSLKNKFAKELAKSELACFCEQLDALKAALLSLQASGETMIDANIVTLIDLLKSNTGRLFIDFTTPNYTFSTYICNNNTLYKIISSQDIVTGNFDTAVADVTNITAVQGEIVKIDQFKCLVEAYLNANTCC